MRLSSRGIGLVIGSHDKPFSTFFRQKWADNLNVSHEAATFTGFHFVGRLCHGSISKRIPPLNIVNSVAELHSPSSSSSGPHGPKNG